MAERVGVLLETNVSADPLEQFHRWFADAEAAGIRAPHAMALATATPDGAPSVRPAGTHDLSGSAGSFEKRWYNPRTGAFEGPPEPVGGGGPLPLGTPPSAPDDDWAVLLRRAP